MNSYLLLMFIFIILALTILVIAYRYLFLREKELNLDLGQQLSSLLRRPQTPPEQTIKVDLSSLTQLTDESSYNYSTKVNYCDPKAVEKVFLFPANFDAEINSVISQLMYCMDEIHQIENKDATDQLFLKENHSIIQQYVKSFVFDINRSFEFFGTHLKGEISLEETCNLYNKIIQDVHENKN